MRRKIITEEEKNRIKYAKLYEAQRNRKYDYSIDDFEIEGGCWRHKSWKTWCKGAESYTETKEKFVKRYIAECKKPYGKSNLSFVHLAAS